MRLGIQINFEDTYEIENIAPDFSTFQFTTYDKKDTAYRLTVRIEKNKNRFLPAVFNLAFGPLNDKEEIDDKAIIDHKDSSKVYSTILFGALIFLNANKDSFVGIDGSNLIRACLYYKLLQTNHDYLSQYFRLIGVKYYIRLLRGKEKEDPWMIDNDDLATQPFIIPKKLSIKSDKMYNYFVFNLMATG